MDPTVNTIVSDVCANNGALLLQILAWGGSAIAGASFVANFRKYLPSWLMPVVDMIALNFVKAAAQAAQQKEPPK